MTVTLAADVRWNDLDQDNGLWLPVDCQGRPEATVGELVERNSSGPLKLGFGGWRDLMLGCQFFNGQGRLITAGGRTVKNVAGYDLTKLMIGQSGILGRPAAITARVHRKPDDALLARFGPDMEIFNRLLISPCRPQWSLLRADGLTCGYLGAGRAVDFYAGQLPAWNPRRLDRHGYLADVKWRTQNWAVAPARELTMRASVPPMRILEFARKANLTDWAADPAFGVLLASVASDAVAVVRQSADDVGGRAWFWKSGDGQVLTDFAMPAVEHGIMRRLKQALDPDDQLAPLPG